MAGRNHRHGQGMAQCGLEPLPLLATARLVQQDYCGTSASQKPAGNTRKSVTLSDRHMQRKRLNPQDSTTQLSDEVAIGNALCFMAPGNPRGLPIGNASALAAPDQEQTGSPKKGGGLM